MICFEGIMKTEKIELRYVKLPMANPMVASFGKVSDRHVIIAKVYTDLGVTYAESPTLHFPGYTSETHRTVMHIFKEFIAPILLENNIETLEELHAKMSWIKGNNMAKHLADTAMCHLLSKSQELSLSKFLGGAKTEVEAGLSIGIKKSIPELLEVVENTINQGFKKVKIKIKPGWDIEPVKAIREKFGNIHLMVDANSAYTLNDAEIFKELDDYDLVMIEQPLSDDDIMDLV